MTNLVFLPEFLGNLNGWEWVIIIVVVLLLFGAKRIPTLMRNVGKGINSFKQGLQDAKEEINKPLEEKKDENNEK